MGDQFIGDLTKGFRNVSVSRKRALQFIGAMIAIAVPARIAPSAQAGKNRKPPEAFVVATLSDPFAPDETAFGFTAQASVVHPATKTTAEFAPSIFADSKASADQMRKQLASGLKDTAVGVLASNGVIVSGDRIAVTLL